MDSAVVHVVVRSAEVPTVEDSVVVPIAEVLIVEVLMVTAVVAEWADTVNS